MASSNTIGNSNKIIVAQLITSNSRTLKGSKKAKTTTMIWGNMVVIVAFFEEYFSV